MGTKKVVARKKPRNAASPLDKVTQRLNQAEADSKRAADDAALAAKRRAAKLALGIIDFQKTTFEHTIAILGRAQDGSAALLTGMLEEAEWVPAEGKQVAREWTQLLAHGRREFEKTVGTSFDLITDYIGRQDCVAAPSEAAPAEAPKPKRKVVAKRKPSKKA